MQGLNFAIIAKFWPCGSSSAQATKKPTPPPPPQQFSITLSDPHPCAPELPYSFVSRSQLPYLSSPQARVAVTIVPTHAPPTLSALLIRPKAEPGLASVARPNRQLPHPVPRPVRANLQPWFAHAEPIVTGLGSRIVPLPKMALAHPRLQWAILRLRIQGHLLH